MKIKDIVIYNNKQWKVIAIVGNYARIRLLNSRAEKIIEIKETIKSLASSQGFYGRLLASMETMEEMFPQDYEKVVEELESQNFQNVVDLVMYFEC